MLLEVLAELSGQPEVHITHLKPGADERIMAQIEAGASPLHPRRLRQGQVLSF
jgi:3',5'-cyclic-nucleotide phosphodiesterase